MVAPSLSPSFALSLSLINLSLSFAFNLLIRRRERQVELEAAVFSDPVYETKFPNKIKQRQLHFAHKFK
jgi:hypothetical protein